MTAKKPPSKKPELVGTTSKVCPTCGAVIQRNGLANLQWIRKRFCSKECHVKLLSMRMFSE